MKLIINIPDELYNQLCEDHSYNSAKIAYRELMNGKPYEERPEGEWILVSERLPEINVDVIVTDIETTGTYSAYYQGDGFWECDNGQFKDRVIAWMPFPEPYQKYGGKEESSTKSALMNSINYGFAEEDD